MYSRTQYISDGSTVQYALNFTLGFLSRSHVFCHVEGEVDALLNPIPRVLTWITDGLVGIGAVVPAGKEILLFRDTPKNILVHDYEDGAGIIAANLDQSNLQSVMLAHEALDNAGTAFEYSIEASIASTAAAALYTLFDARWLGSKTSEPTLDNTGSALLTGATYWNSVSNNLYIYSGSEWLDATGTIQAAAAAASASIATAQAGIATTKADIAVNASDTATAKADEAAGSAVTATTQAVLAVGNANTIISIGDTVIAAQSQTNVLLGLGIGSSYVDIEGDLIMSYNDATVTSLSINTDGELLLVY